MELEKARVVFDKFYRRYVVGKRLQKICMVGLDGEGLFKAQSTDLRIKITLDQPKPRWLRLPTEYDGLPVEVVVDMLERPRLRGRRYDSRPL